MTTALTLGEALTLTDEETEDLGSDEVHFTPAEAEAAVEAWARLMGADSDEARTAARAEVLDDTPLMVHLHQSAAEFDRWWRSTEWQHFTRSEREGDAWAWDVLDRVRLLTKGLGAMAGQVSLSVAINRQRGA
jgi:hypothetical protein